MTTKLNNADVQQMEANDIRTSTLTGTAFDVREYVGDILVILHSDAGTGTTPTLDGKIQDSATSGGSFVNVSGATFAEIDDTAGGAHETIIIPANSVKRWLKFIGTIAGGGSESFGFGVTIIGIKKIH